MRGPSVLSFFAAVSVAILSSLRNWSMDEAVQNLLVVSRSSIARDILLCLTRIRLAAGIRKQVTADWSELCLFCRACLP